MSEKTQNPPSPSNTVTLRDFQACLSALRALGPLPSGGESALPSSAELVKQQAGRVDEVWSFDDLSCPPSAGDVLENLAFIADDELRFESLARLDSAEDALASSLWNGVGAWNAADEAAIWCGEPGEWIVVQADLSREDDEHDAWISGSEPTTCEVTFAAWRVVGGLAIYVTDFAHGVARVAALSDLALPDKDDWKDAAVSYGE